MIDLERIKIRLRRANLEDVLESFDWKEFEKVVAKIFEFNDFSVKLNFRFKVKQNRPKRYEIDLIASRSGCVFCVDCKKWRGGRYKKHALKRAVAVQKERVHAYKIFLRHNKADHSIKSKIYPLIVTLMEEELVEVDGIFIVPVWKLSLIHI